MNGVCRGRLAGGATLRRRRVVGEDATPPEVEEHRGRNDRDHLAGLAHRPAHARGIQVLAHPVGGGQAERAAPGEDDGVDLVDEVARVEQVGLPGAGALPRTSTPATAPSGGARTTVVPVSQPGSVRVACPTRMPRTSVSEFVGPGRMVTAT